jgi:hypothetical protein
MVEKSTYHSRTYTNTEVRKRIQLPRSRRPSISTHLPPHRVAALAACLKLTLDRKQRTCMNPSALRPITSFSEDGAPCCNDLSFRLVHFFSPSGSRPFARGVPYHRHRLSPAVVCRHLPLFRRSRILPDPFKLAWSHVINNRGSYANSRPIAPPKELIWPQVATGFDRRDRISQPWHGILHGGMCDWTRSS